MLVDATGLVRLHHLGFEQVTALVGTLGVVCHFYNGKTPWENALDEANWRSSSRAALRGLRERGVNRRTSSITARWAFLVLPLTTL